MAKEVGELDLEEPIEASFVLKIPNFRAERSQCNKGERLRLPTVSISGVDFEVQVYPKGVEEDDSEEKVRIRVISSKTIVASRLKK